MISLSMGQLEHLSYYTACESFSVRHKAITSFKEGVHASYLFKVPVHPEGRLTQVELQSAVRTVNNLMLKLNAEYLNELRGLSLMQKSFLTCSSDPESKYTTHLTTYQLALINVDNYRQEIQDQLDYIYNGIARLSLKNRVLDVVLTSKEAKLVAANYFFHWTDTVDIFTPEDLGGKIFVAHFRDTTKHQADTLTSSFTRCNFRILHQQFAEIAHECLYSYNEISQAYWHPVLSYKALGGFVDHSPFFADEDSQEIIVATGQLLSQYAAEKDGKVGPKLLEAIELVQATLTNKLKSLGQAYAADDRPLKGKKIHVSQLVPLAQGYLESLGLAFNPMAQRVCDHVSRLFESVTPDLFLLRLANALKGDFCKTSP